MVTVEIKPLGDLADAGVDVLPKGHRDGFALEVAKDDEEFAKLDRMKEGATIAIEIKERAGET